MSEKELGRRDGNPNALPNLIIAGAQKSGTTWLHNLLGRHPDVFMSSPKELSFFNKPSNVNNREALADYAMKFEDGEGKRYVGESTPHYFWVKSESSPYSPPSSHDTAKHIRDTLGPDSIIFVVLRNPVIRAVSAYHHHFAMGRVTGTESVLDCPAALGIVDMGFYRRHLLHWRPIFGEKLNVLLYDDIQSNPSAFLADVWGRLGLDLQTLPERDLTRRINRKDAILSRHGSASEFPPVSPDDVAALHDLYFGDVVFVESCLNRSLPDWRDVEVMKAAANG